MNGKIIGKRWLNYHFVLILNVGIFITKENLNYQDYTQIFIMIAMTNVLNISKMMSCQNIGAFLIKLFN